MLNKKTRKLLQDIISRSFDKFKGSFVGPAAFSTSYIFTLKDHPRNSRISDAYVHANTSSSMQDTIDRSTIEALDNTTINYLDALKLKATADIMRSVEENLSEAKNKGKLIGKTPYEYLKSKDGQEILTKIKDQLDDQKNKITKGLDLIANVQLNNAQNHGVADAILGMSSSLGDEDPTVAKIGIVDNELCKDCKRLWHKEGEIMVPKVYKMSELAGDPGHWKSRVPSVSSTHPNCRHHLVYVAKGFGFTNKGKFQYISKDHDEYKHQNS